MTKYQKIKASAKAKGIDTRKSVCGGYWLTNDLGQALYQDDNFCSSLKELEYEVAQY